MSVTLVDYALLSLQELKGYLNAGPGGQQDDNLKRAINGATGLIEGHLKRRLVTRITTGTPATITEYHTLAGASRACEVYLSEWPIIAIATVHESDDSPRIYDGTTALAADQYETIASAGLLRRVEDGEPEAFMVGNRAIRVAYSAGYRDAGGIAATAPPLPEDLRQAAFAVAASIWKESDRRGWGVSSVSDATGSVTRFMGHLPPSLEAALSRHRRIEVSRTWELAA